MLEYDTNAQDAGQRPDRALRLRLPSVDRDAALQLLKRGKILVNGQPATLRTAHAPGERVIVEPASIRPRRALTAGVDLLFVDGFLCVVGKPSGMAVHPATGVAGLTLVDAVRDFLDGNLTSALAPAGRLDRGTSGAVVFALQEKSHQLLGRAFQSGEIEKNYFALVQGTVREPLEVTVPIPVDGELKEARTRCTPLCAGASASLLEVFPLTGRKHQIRRHLAHVGHPIVGDQRYGGPPSSRLMLHARGLTLPHPMLGSVRVVAPLPGDFVEAARQALGVIPSRVL